MDKATEGAEKPDKPRKRRKRTKRPFGGSIFEFAHRRGELFGRFKDPVTGKRKTVKLLNGTDAKARKKAEEILGDKIREARSMDPASGELRSVTLRQFIDKEFIPLAETKVGAAHLIDLKARLGRAADYFSDSPMSRIGKTQAEEFIAKLTKEEGRGRLVAIGTTDDGDEITENRPLPKSAGTIRHYRNALNKCWRAAIERNAAKANPWTKIELPRGQRHAVKFATPAEIALVLAHVPERHRDLFTFLSETGLRLGEARALTWPRVKPGFGAITVEKSKTGEPREVPCSAPAKAVLTRRWKMHVAPLNGPDYVFEQRERTWLWSVWNKACLAAGVGRGLRIHDLRHYVGSSLAQAGVPLSTVASILGHSTVSVTEMYASHVPSNAAERAFAALDAARALSAPEVKKAAGE